MYARTVLCRTLPVTMIAAGFLAALQSATTWQNDGTTVTLSNAEGQTAVTFVAAA